VEKICSAVFDLSHLTPSELQMGSRIIVAETLRAAQEAESEIQNVQSADEDAPPSDENFNEIAELLRELDYFFGEKPMGSDEATSKSTTSHAVPGSELDLPAFLGGLLMAGIGLFDKTARTTISVPDHIKDIIETDDHLKEIFDEMKGLFQKRSEGPEKE